MIPKIIHYCWFGRNPLPPLALKCIESWRKYLPDYEIKEWNEDNFDVNIIPYTAEAYKAKKYAFVSDYARFWILYKYGGLYFDTDVEVIRNMDDIIAKGPFMGIEGFSVNANYPVEVAPGLGLGVNPGRGLYKELLDYYSNLLFIREDGSVNTTTIVKYTTELLCKHGLSCYNELQNCAGVWIYPQEYFNPLHEINYKKTLSITDKTCTIHWWAASWQPKSKEYLAKCKRFLMSVMGVKTTLFIIEKLRLRELRSHLKI